MLSGKKISLKNVISKVYSDLNLKDDNYIINIIEWLGEAISKIKTDQQLESIPYELCIDNHKAELPCDLIYLEEVNFEGNQMLKASANHLIKEDFSKEVLYYQTFTADRRYDGVKNIAFDLGQRYNITKELYFVIENGWFKTSLDKGKVNILYKRLPVDEEGYPLIPEEESYREALFWYCAWKYFYIKKIESDNNEFRKFDILSQEAKANWHWYCGQAGSESLMPDLFMLENIKRNFLSLVPKHDSFNKFFSDLNK